LVCNSSK
jgi:hypothetical protein